MYIFLAFLGLVTIFFALKWISGHLEEACVGLASKLKLPASVAGATLLAISSSAPEFFTSLSSAAFQGIFEIGLVTIIWSAIFNILAIPGFVGIMSKKPLTLAKEGLIRDLLFYFMIVLFLLMSMEDGVISRLDSMIFLVFYMAYIGILWFNSRNGKKDIHEKLAKSKISNKTIFLLFTVGISSVGLLCWAMIELGVFIAESLVSAKHLVTALAIISALIFSIGSSVPDLFLSIAATKRGSGSEAIANAFGSNTFDIAIGLGIPLLIVGGTKIDFSSTMPSVVMLLLSFVISAFVVIRGWKIKRWEGATCLFAFAICMMFLLFGTHESRGVMADIFS